MDNGEQAETWDADKPSTNENGLELSMQTNRPRKRTNKRIYCSKWGRMVNGSGIRLEEERLASKPVARPEFQLDDLLEQVTPENLQEEIDMGEPVGDEFW